MTEEQKLFVDILRGWLIDTVGLDGVKKHCELAYEYYQLQDSRSPYNTNVVKDNTNIFQVMNSYSWAWAREQTGFDWASLNSKWQFYIKDHKDYSKIKATTIEYKNLIDALKLPLIDVRELSDYV